MYVKLNKEEFCGKDLTLRELLSEIDLECISQGVSCGILTLVGEFAVTDLYDKQLSRRLQFSTCSFSVEQTIISVCKRHKLKCENVFFEDKYSAKMEFSGQRILVEIFSNIIVYRQTIRNALLFLIVNHSKELESKIEYLYFLIGERLSLNDVYVLLMWFYNLQIFEVEGFLGSESVKFLSQLFVL